ncbi:MAG TPA: pantoate--beta-alanine ligase [Planctomycetes bacterium]|nr:pantoate--beta-alanine ligase [Planctomycetota bacterium]
MILCRTVSELREALGGIPREERGFVPTMGALHRGHLSLVEAALARGDQAVVSIFVNPLQFGPNEDLDRYPRTEKEDLALLREAGVALVFLPSVEEMFPQGARSFVEVEGLSEELEGALRPGHFRGVATVCARLFHLFEPARGYFGWKDMQQVCLLKKMVSDLAFPLEIVPCPVVREEDGLALSSRNRFLDAEQRVAAVSLSQGLRRACFAFAQGERRRAVLETLVRDALSPSLRCQYVAVRRSEDFSDPGERVDGGRILAAALLGGVHLIDNMPLEEAPGAGIDAS